MRPKSPESSKELQGDIAMPQKRGTRVAVGLLLSLLGLLVGVLAYHQVDNSITEEDALYIRKYVDTARPSFERNQRTVEDELDFIVHVQRSVLQLAPGREGISFNREREPKDLYLAQSGSCYDRSRVIEKILRHAGFDTRHVALFSTRSMSNPLEALMTPGVSSHAVTEVLTSKGWLVVDSNDYWVSVDREGTPYSIDRILSDVAVSRIRWEEPIPNDIYTAPFVPVYGLYSRHGRFYPPYNFIPDVNYRELMQNW